MDVPHGISRALRLVALAWAAVVTVLAGAFAAGEALADPGGITGVAMVALWVVPLAVLVVLAIRAPERALPLLAAVVVGVVVLAVWQATTPRTFDRIGPAAAIASLVALLPLAIIGRWRPWATGLLLAALALAPIGATALVGHIGMGSSIAIAIPILLAAVLLLLAALLARRS